METATLDIKDSYLKRINEFDISNISDGLIYGKLGLLLFYLSQYEKNNDDYFLEKIALILEKIFENLKDNIEGDLYRSSSLSEGITGFAYIINFLVEEKILDEEYLSEIKNFNSIIYETTKKSILENNFDFISGSIGNLWYLLKIKDYKSVDLLFEILEEKSRTEEYLFYTDSENPFIDGMNFGLAHGHLGLINFLIKSIDHLEKKESVKELTQKLIDHTIKHFDFDYSIDGIHIYKSYKMHLKDDELVKYQNNRLAWCNSDLTLAYILLKAGEKLQNEDYQKLAFKIGLETTKRKDMNVTGIESDFFCHGSSGVAFLYKKIFEITQNEEFIKAYYYWIDRTMVYLEEKVEKEFDERDMSLLHGRLGSLMTIDKDINTDKYLEILI
ncbi:Lanthionine synthetase C-like protein [Flavobacterium columnare]|uniref:Lanthionine synthetase LanC family protein n=2 Tax=Flavobacterium TaxID=237 RepID=A0ABW8PLK8_9FLAO|nr:lanthionine synthetase LanC family protein [Flavobacterium columnare]SPE77538.1 Lanthionine synthetase C-like protein [Flavobacterium columnare]